MTLDQQRPVATVCPTCGAALFRGDKFCTECGHSAGAEVDAPPAPPAASPEAPARTPIRKQRWIGIGGAIAVVAALALVVSQLSGGAGHAPTFAGIKIHNPKQLLQQAESQMRSQATSRRAHIATDNRCYFSSAPGAKDVNDFLRCGPVLFSDSAQNSPWMQMPFRVDSTGLATFTGATATGTALAAGEQLRRPDGAHAPTNITLTVPDPLPQAADYAAVVGDLPDGLVVQGPQGDGRLEGPDFALQIAGLAQTPRIGTGPQSLIAAAGKQFVVAEFASTPGRFAPSANGTAIPNAMISPETAPPSAALVTDGKASNLGIFSQFESGGNLVVSVPKGATDVSLVVTDHGRKQSISLLTGRRGPDAVATYYRPKVEIHLGESISSSVPNTVDGATLSVSAEVPSATLSPWIQGAGWAPAGKAWLYVQFDNWSTSSTSLSYQFNTQASFSLSAPGMKPALPTHGSYADTDTTGSLFVFDVVFLVPDSITKATLATHPVFTLFDNGPGLAQNMPATAPITINFGPAA